MYELLLLSYSQDAFDRGRNLYEKGHIICFQPGISVNSVYSSF